MTIAAIREKLHDYINVADDEKVKAIYTLVEGQITRAYDWANDKEFVAGLDAEYKDYEEGVDKGMSLEELEASIEIRKGRRSDV